MCTNYVCAWCLQKPEELVRSPRIGVIVVGAGKTTGYLVKLLMGLRPRTPSLEDNEETFFFFPRSFIYRSASTDELGEDSCTEIFLKSTVKDRKLFRKRKRHSVWEQKTRRPQKGTTQRPSPTPPTDAPCLKETDPAFPDPLRFLVYLPSQPQGKPCSSWELPRPY